MNTNEFQYVGITHEDMKGERDAHHTRYFAWIDGLTSEIRYGYVMREVASYNSVSQPKRIVRY